MADNRTMSLTARQLGPPDAPAKLLRCRRCRRRLLGRHANQRQRKRKPSESQRLQGIHIGSKAISFGLTHTSLFCARFPDFSLARKPEVTQERLDALDQGRRAFERGPSISRSDKKT